MVKFLRRNIGTLVSGLGFLIICIVTFGDLGEISTTEYWKAVKDNLTSIGFMTISLTMIQVVIKQGMSEQALQKGLNSVNTVKAYKEHMSAIKSCNDRMVYLPYFLRVRNDMQTKLAKNDFLANNGYTSEDSLFKSNNKKAIKKYNKIKIKIRATDIKWTPNEVKVKKNGRIETLAEHRRKRIFSAIVSSMVFVVALSLLTKGLFFNASDTPIWQKFVKLATYIISLTLGSVMGMVKEYEKGALGVPADLAIVNEIWYEFRAWEIPEYVLKELEEMNYKTKEVKEDEKESTETIDVGADLQREQEESETF